MLVHGSAKLTARGRKRAKENVKNGDGTPQDSLVLSAGTEIKNPGGGPGSVLKPNNYHPKYALSALL